MMVANYLTVYKSDHKAGVSQRRLILETRKKKKEEKRKKRAENLSISHLKMRGTLKIVTVAALLAVLAVATQAGPRDKPKTHEDSDLERERERIQAGIEGIWSSQMREKLLKDDALLNTVNGAIDSIHPMLQALEETEVKHRERRQKGKGTKGSTNGGDGGNAGGGGGGGVDQTTALQEIFDSILDLVTAIANVISNAVTVCLAGGIPFVSSSFDIGNFTACVGVTAITQSPSVFVPLLDFIFTLIFELV